jgi:hypothetical protein
MSQCGGIAIIQNAAKIRSVARRSQAAPTGAIKGAFGSIFEASRIERRVLMAAWLRSRAAPQSDGGVVRAAALLRELHRSPVSGLPR